MNICFVNDRFSRRGGVSRVTTELANSLQENGNKVSIIDFSGENQFYFNIHSDIVRHYVISKRKLKRRIITKILNLKYSLSKNPLKIIDLYKEQKEDLVRHLKGNNYDVLIMCQGVLTALVPHIKKEIPNLKIVAWQHNEYEVYVKNYHKKYINDYLLGIKSSDLVVCLTKEDQEKFSKLNKNSTCIYNPLTITNVEKHISNLNNKNIIFVGRLLIEQKGLDFLLEVGKRINNDWSILVAGDGADKQKFNHMIRENKLEKRILLTGMLDNKGLIELYKNGSIFISTSRWEGFGLVVTEAMSFGLPIISFETRGPKEILENGKHGILIEQNNISEFCKKVNYLIDSLETREKYQEKSLKRSQDFKSEVILKEWISRLSEL